MSELERENGGEAVPEGARWAKGHHVLLYFLGAALVVWLLTGIYTIRPSEVGIVERMGAWVTSDEGHQVVLREAGTYWGLPWPLDVVYHVPINQALSLEVADFDSSSAAVEAMKKDFMRQNGLPKVLLDALFDPYLITADKNVLNARLTVQYRIVDAGAYLSSMYEAGGGKDWEKAAREAIGQVAAHVLIREVARTPVDTALWDGKQALMERIRKGMGPEVAALGLGIQVDNVTATLRWPAAVDEAFKSVQEAKYGAKTSVEAAVSYANSVKTQAGVDGKSGDAARIHEEAEAYRTKVIAEAQGEAQRFSQVYKQYRESPALTRTSLYADAVGTVVASASRMIYVQAGQKVTIMIESSEEKRGGGAMQAGPGGP